MNFRVTLTSAQRSALECSTADEGEHPVLFATLSLGAFALTFSEGERRALVRELIDLANAEDVVAKMQRDRLARGACTALTNLAALVGRAR